MKRNVLKVVFLAVILAGCGGQADAGGDSEAAGYGVESQSAPAVGQADCTTMAWEAGMEYLGDEEAKEIGGSCDSFYHFRTTEDLFCGKWTAALAELGLKVENERSESQNVRYQNPRSGYLEFDASLLFDMAAGDTYIKDNQLRYDTASGQIHSIKICGRSLKECADLMELFSETESRLCEDERLRLGAERLEDWYHSPFVRKEQGWSGESTASIGMNGYEVKLLCDSVRNVSTVWLSPSFDRDHGRLLSQAEAEMAGEACGRFTHFNITIDQFAPKAAGQLADMGYETGDETNWSYNYAYELSPNGDGRRPGEYTCYDSRSLWILKAEGMRDDFFWLEADWDTATKKVHSISAVLDSREECYELCSALLDAEADAGGGGFLRKNAGEWMAEADDSFGSERIYADGGRITYCAIVTNGYQDNDTYRIEIKGY